MCGGKECSAEGDPGSNVFPEGVNGIYSRQARQSEPMWSDAFRTVGSFFRPCVQAFAYPQKCALAFQTVQRAAPYCDDVPARILPGFLVSPVALDIFGPFLHPELDVASRHCRVCASVTVPKASAHIDDCSGLRDDDVRLAQKAFVADPEPPTGGKDALSHQNFGRGVPASDPTHYPASLLWGYPVHNCRRLYHSDSLRCGIMSA